MKFCRLLPRCINLFSEQLSSIRNVQRRFVQVSVLGAAGDIGRNVSLLLKQNQYITKLQLYDDDNRVKGFGLELEQIPGGPAITTFSGDSYLPAALRYSHCVLMLARVPRKLGYTREQMLAANAIPLQKICRTLSNQNPDAFFAISTNPINSIVPFASTLLYSYNAYNPFKIFGITHLDTARARSLVATALKANPRHISVPVIGGHSDETIVPLFSNLTPSHYSVGPCQTDTLTRLLKKAGTEVLNHKAGNDTATLAMAWSINEFVALLVEALYGSNVVVNCFCTNPNFGTRYFSGPTKVGPCGIIETCSNFQMNDFERSLLKRAIPKLNRDIHQGEDHVNVIESVRNFF